MSKVWDIDPSLKSIANPLKVVTQPIRKKVSSSVPATPASHPEFETMHNYSQALTDFMADFKEDDLAPPPVLVPTSQVPPKPVPSTPAPVFTGPSSVTQPSFATAPVYPTAPSTITPPTAPTFNPPRIESFGRAPPPVIGHNYQSPVSSFYHPEPAPRFETHARNKFCNPLGQSVFDQKTTVDASKTNAPVTAIASAFKPLTTGSTGKSGQQFTAQDMSDLQLYHHYCAMGEKLPKLDDNEFIDMGQVRMHNARVNQQRKLQIYKEKQKSPFINIATAIEGATSFLPLGLDLSGITDSVEKELDNHDVMFEDAFLASPEVEAKLQPKDIQSELLWSFLGKVGRKVVEGLQQNKNEKKHVPAIAPVPTAVPPWYQYNAYAYGQQQPPSTMHAGAPPSSGRYVPSDDDEKPSRGGNDKGNILKSVMGAVGGLLGGASGKKPMVEQPVATTTPFHNPLLSPSEMEYSARYWGQYYAQFQQPQPTVTSVPEATTLQPTVTSVPQPTTVQPTATVAYPVPEPKVTTVVEPPVTAPMPTVVVKPSVESSAPAGPPKPPVHVRPRSMKNDDPRSHEL